MHPHTAHKWTNAKGSCVRKYDEKETNDEDSAKNAMDWSMQLVKYENDVIVTQR